MNPRLIAMLSVVLVAGCAHDRAETPSVESAQAELRDSGGRLVAHATANRAGPGVRVALEVSGLAPGSYGVHLHEIGRCDPPGFTSAGGHWNPTGRQHGGLNPQGPHKGDLPNLAVGTNGRGTLAFTVPDAAFARGSGALLDDDGAAVVIHAGPDDYRSDPSGNSGARIACGVFD